MTNKEHFSIMDLMTPALGYLLVVIICIMSGNSLRNDLSFQSFLQISPEQFLFWLLLVPVFINRVIMYEQPATGRFSVVNQEWRKVSLELPIIIFIFSLFVFFFLSLSFKSSGYSTYVFEREKIISLIIALLPFYIQTTISWFMWKENKSKDHFNFRSYIFFPALTTCVISFLVGWSKLTSPYVVLIPSVAITVYYIISFVDKSNIRNWKLTDWILLFSIISFFIYEFAIAIPFKISSNTPIDTKNSLIIMLSCIMMALIMGITETWWLIKDTENKSKFHFADLDFYEKRLNKITAILPLIMPLAIFHPQTNNFFYSILLYAILLCVIWFYGQGIKNQYWRYLRFFFGIILPILFSISLRNNEGIQSITNNKTILNVIPVVALMLSCVALFSKRDKTNRLFSDLSESKQLGFVICIIFLGVFWALSQLFSIDGSKIIEKINLLILFYFIILFVFLIEILLKISKYNISNNESESTNSGIKNMMLFFSSGRPLTSLLSGILSFLIIFNVQHNIFISIFKAMPIVIVTMLGFIYNDIYDREKDLKAGKLRPITIGNLNSSLATRLTLIVAIFIMVYEILINNFYSFSVIVVTLVGVILYSPISKKYPLIKVIFTALLCCAPMIYGYAIVGDSIIWYKFIPILLFIIGREIWLDKLDLKGDIISEIKTISFYLGNNKSFWVSLLFMFIGSLSILLFVSTMLGFIISLFSILTLVACFIIAFKDESLAIKISRIPMLLGILALTI